MFKVLSTFSFHSVPSLLLTYISFDIVSNYFELLLVFLDIFNSNTCISKRIYVCVCVLCTCFCAYKCMCVFLWLISRGTISQCHYSLHNYHILNKKVFDEF